MSRTRYVSLLGLGFGDCGKGLFTDALTRMFKAHTVVRFNGGAQAGHNVVLPDGRHHTFSQFGAGTFADGTMTVLASPVVVHPSAILFEARALERAGVAGAMTRLMIDGRCRVTTPFHQAAGRLREHWRGLAAHGTCGVGVGETVAFELLHPGEGLRYAELHLTALAHEKLVCIQQSLRAEIGALLSQTPVVTSLRDEWRLLNDEGVAARWLEQIAPVLQCVNAQTADAIGTRLSIPGTVIFEGAQGVLLDEWRGFHPHTSWSTISTQAVENVLTDVGNAAPVEHFGVLRSYLTRHGAGPFPTHDAALNVLAEPHNSAAGWQGEFRRGHPDAVLLRYALACVGKLEGLVVSHLDVFDRIPALRWCDAYTNAATLGVGKPQNLTHQTALTALLTHAVPRYDRGLITRAEDLLARFEATAELPIRYFAEGSTHQAVRQSLKH